MIERREGQNNREAEKGRDGWRRKEARPQQPSGRFQLVMETGVAHPAEVVTDFTCPPDIHSRSRSAPQPQTLYLSDPYSILPLLCPSLCISVLSLLGVIVFINFPSSPSSITFSAFPSHTFSSCFHASSSSGFYPFSLPSLSSHLLSLTAEL